MPLHVRIREKTSIASLLSSRRNWSGGGVDGGKKSGKREGAKTKGTRTTGRNKSEKREEHKEARGNAGQRRRWSDTNGQSDAKKNASQAVRRKRKGDHDSWNGDHSDTPYSKSKLTRNGPSTMTRGKASARKGDRFRSETLDEDDLHSRKRGNSMVSSVSRGGRSNSMVSGITREGKSQSVFSRNAEASSKGKKFDTPTRVSRQKEAATDANLDDHGAESKKSDDSGQIADEKPRPRRTRVLDKTGKKIRVANKDPVSDIEETLPPKKRKRMKLDPYDTSNKRLEDSTAKQDVCSPEKIPEKSPPEETETSINAKFRAIQPSSSIISYVEDNLLGRRRLNEIKNAGYNVKLSAPLDNVPFSTSPERERIEENVFRNKLEFFAAAKISSSFPPPTLPEIAFAGVSNVGKSSLLNALTRQWGVVRTSDKPGLTQTINFFRLASKLCLVDLPGYGFAYAKDEVKDSWQELVKEYVSTRVGLERVCLLVHTKRGMKPLDYELVDLMERSKTPYQIVLTKTDLVFPIDVARRAVEIQESLKKNKSVVRPVMMVSSKTGAGVRNLRGVLGKIARFIKP
ncbi:uncharacterized protein [Oryza sativa Japonica Group]|nr:uncharacterized protein LOC4334564 [Oryza sativa Japonica Group]KAB8094174.1 hypothetical protein EE612_021275 [Oryza sativa]AAO60011.1 putative GTP-binding protein [Oryza sativa Japonica Group]ABF99547.1 expressed protein [Oryza sativa Japonica Group]KAF2942014.1 hypothetical protein DAI22_03g390100 [Oryza sativa Japonica Group]BAF13606.1 Os03g0816400 [Oryza sativa Japonica Group]|eukprot:NP_001051692.1 Os03g0816400 [Oryza sativa Japonica Group]